MKRSKRYNLEEAKIDKNKKYTIVEAIQKSVETSSTKFDSSIDAQISLNLKEKQKKESVRGTISFPNSIGEAPKIAVIAESADQKKAKDAGADFVGLEDLIEKIDKGWTEFDVLIASPSVMIKVAKLGKVIGAKGLMPNPKNDTVTQDIEKSVKNFKAGKTNFKMNEAGMFQISFAKASMKEEQIIENFKELMTSINDSTKTLGENILKSIIISSSMGPSIKVDVNTIDSI
jgi:large subunit ribosomal protein L1